MNDQSLKILLVDANLDYARFMRQGIEDAFPGHLAIKHACSLQAAQHELGQEDFDLILLDLELPDSLGFATFIEIHNQSPYRPVLVIAALDDPSLALRLLAAGAQDYLVKGETNTKRLVIAIQYALERQGIIEQLKQLSLVDELTSLLNRRGFFSLGKQHINIALRAERQLLLFYIDLDGLKHINDRFGHHEGDRALIKIADILKETFRSSDLIARMGGDEFTVLAIDAVQESAENILNRLGNKLHTANLKNPVYNLSLSTGFARFDPQSATDLENMLIEADNALYRYRRKKNAS